MDELASAETAMNEMRRSHPRLAGLWCEYMKSLRRDILLVAKEARDTIENMREVDDMTAGQISAIWAVHNSA